MHRPLIAAALAAGLASIGAAAAAARPADDHKILICHFTGNPDRYHEILIARSAWPAHQRHGDVMGRCQATQQPSTTFNDDTPSTTVYSGPSTTAPLPTNPPTTAPESTVDKPDDSVPPTDPPKGDDPTPEPTWVRDNPYPPPATTTTQLGVDVASGALLPETL